MIIESHYFELNSAVGLLASNQTGVSCAKGHVIRANAQMDKFVK